MLTWCKLVKNLPSRPSPPQIQSPWSANAGVPYFDTGLKCISETCSRLHENLWKQRNNHICLLQWHVPLFWAPGMLIPPYETNNVANIREYFTCWKFKILSNEISYSASVKFLFVKGNGWVWFPCKSGSCRINLCCAADTHSLLCCRDFPSRLVWLSPALLTPALLRDSDAFDDYFF